MSSFAVIALDPDASEWRLGRDELVDALGRRWPDARIDTEPLSEVDDLRWVVGDWDIDAHANLDRTCIYIRADDIHLAAVAAWFRALVPHSVDLHLADTTGVYFFDLPPGTADVDLLERMRASEAAGSS